MLFDAGRAGCAPRIAELVYHRCRIQTKTSTGGRCSLAALVQGCAEPLLVEVFRGELQAEYELRAEQSRLQPRKHRPPPRPTGDSPAVLAGYPGACLRFFERARVWRQIWDAGAGAPLEQETDATRAAENRSNSRDRTPWTSDVSEMHQR